MILFILEGQSEERIAKTIQKLYFEERKGDIIYSYRNNIYQLYDRLVAEREGFESFEGAVDILRILKEKNPADKTLHAIEDVSDIEETYLFFDYDFQHAIKQHEKNPSKTLDECIIENNRKIREMLDFFNEETEMGRLFVNYPMVESLFYTKTLPDDNYKSYNVDFATCQNNGFKRLVNKISAYKNRAPIIITKHSKISENEVKENWELLKVQNIAKANAIITGEYKQPATKDGILQDKIFDAQESMYAATNHIGVLNSFPLFLYYYFK